MIHLIRKDIKDIYRCATDSTNPTKIEQPLGEDNPENMAAITKVTHSLAACSQTFPSSLRLFYPPQPSYPPLTGRRTVGEAAGKADAKSSYESPPSSLTTSLSALYLIDTCSLVNPGLPPGIAPHGSVTNVSDIHTSNQSSRRTHILTTAALPHLFPH